MKIKVRFICAKPYDFTTESGERVRGCNLMCFEETGNAIIKVKQTQTLEPLKFGDVIEVNAIVSGTNVKFSI